MWALRARSPAPGQIPGDIGRGPIPPRRSTVLSPVAKREMVHWRASRARETEADRYAAAPTMRARLPAFEGLPALAIFTSLDETHPIASCRIVEALLYTLDRLAEDETTAHLFENDPDMLPGGSRYQFLRTRMNETCP
jgi:hypothetical protein